MSEPVNGDRAVDQVVDIVSKALERQARKIEAQGKDLRLDMDKLGNRLGAQIETLGRSVVELDKRAATATAVGEVAVDRWRAVLDKMSEMGELKERLRSTTSEMRERMTTVESQVTAAIQTLQTRAETQEKWVKWQTGLTAITLATLLAAGVAAIWP